MGRARGSYKDKRGGTALSIHVLAYPHVGVLFPEGVLVDRPVRSPPERERVTDERLGLLPHIVGLFGDQLVFGTVVGV